MNARQKDTTRHVISRRGFLAASTAAASLGLPWSALAAQTPHRGGTLTMAVWPDPTMLTCAFTTSDQVLVAATKASDGLAVYDYDFKPHPRLATAWEVAADGLSIRFTLRKGVKWHDGHDFTSADVAFTLLHLIKPNHPRGRGTYANLIDVETPDAFTAVLRLSKPSPVIMNALSNFETPMLPKHIYEKGDPLRNPANNAPIGTGPYRYVEWVRGSHITFERNPNYWDKGGPYLDRIVMRIIKDAEARSAALDANEILIAGPNPVPDSEIATFRANPKYSVETRGEELLEHEQGIQINLRNPILAKREVRAAILHAINRQALATAVWYGNARPATTPVPFQNKALHLVDAPAYPYDVKKANALLDAAGFKRKGNGFRFSVKLDWVPLGEANLNAAQFVKQSLQRVGIQTTIRSSDLPTYLKLIYTDYNFDLNLFLFAPIFDPSMGLQRFYWSKSARRGSPFVNASGYSNPAMDKVLEAAATELDPEKRKQDFYEFQKIAMTDLPILPLLDLIYPTIVNKRVHDLMQWPEGLRGNFADVWISA